MDIGAITSCRSTAIRKTPIIAVFRPECPVRPTWRLADLLVGVCSLVLFRSDARAKRRFGAFVLMARKGGKPLHQAKLVEGVEMDTHFARKARRDF